jgi:hypothetical protein
MRFSETDVCHMFIAQFALAEREKLRDTIIC